MGYSFLYDMPVNKVVGDRLTPTFIVSVATIVFTYLVAFPIGVYSATHQYSLGDYALTFLGFLGLATPSFLLALVLVYLAHVWFGISVGGLMDPSYLNQPWGGGKAMSVLAHMWIPVIVIGTAGTASMIRRLRANLLDELQKQYVVTARAKGLHPLKVLLKYPLRMALNPFISDIGSLLPQVISGAVIVSVVMSLPTTGPDAARRAAQPGHVASPGRIPHVHVVLDGDRGLHLRSGAGDARPPHPPAIGTPGMTSTSRSTRRTAEAQGILTRALTSCRITSRARRSTRCRSTR